MHTILLIDSLDILKSLSIKNNKILELILVIPPNKKTKLTKELKRFQNISLLILYSDSNDFNTNLNLGISRSIGDSVIYFNSPEISKKNIDFYLLNNNHEFMYCLKDYHNFITNNFGKLISFIAGFDIRTFNLTSFVISKRLINISMNNKRYVGPTLNYLSKIAVSQKKILHRSNISNDPLISFLLKKNKFTNILFYSKKILASISLLLTFIIGAQFFILLNNKILNIDFKYFIIFDILVILLLIKLLFSYLLYKERAVFSTASIIRESFIKSTDITSNIEE